MGDDSPKKCKDDEHSWHVKERRPIGNQAVKFERDLVCTRCGETKTERDE